MRQPAALVLPVLLAAAACLHAETIVGGLGEIACQVMLEPDSLERSQIGLSTSLSPALSVDTEYYDVSARGTLSYEDGFEGLLATIDELCVVLDPARFLQLRIGRFAYLPGSAFFFSNTQYFARRDFGELLTGRLDRLYLPNDMLQTAFFAGAFYLRLTAAPFRHPAVIPEPDSPWLPDKDLPQSITVHFPSTHVLVLRNLLVEEAPIPPFDFRQVSFAAEAGGTMHPVDFALMYYHGADNSPLLKAAFEFPEGLNEFYEVILIPVNRTIDAVGCNAAAQVGPFTFWSDNSVTLAKTFLTNRLSEAALETSLAKHSCLEYSVGGSYTPSFADGLGVIEYHDAIVFGEDNSVVEPLLSAALVAMVQLDLLTNRLSPAVTWVQSLLDGSAALYLRLSFNPSIELEAQLSAPLFFGPADSELGQFRDNHLLRAAAIWRF